MIRLNLLPYREALRAKKKRQVGMALAGILVMATLTYCGIFQIFSAQVEAKHRQVQYLQTVSKHLKAKIGSVVDLRKKRADLIARAELIARLQDQRNQATQIFDSLAKLTPEGVFLTELQSSRSLITVQGDAQGSAQVAKFMRNIQASSVFSHPVLNIISRFKLGPDNSTSESVDRFTLYMHWRRHKPVNKNGDPDHDA